MGLCKDCKWWSETIGLESEEKCHVCDYSDDFKRGRPEEIFETEIVAADDTGLECQLVTGPEFGCIHFKQK